MECSEVRLKLDEYIKNRLGRDVGEKVTLHLRECQQCFEESNMLKEINEILNVEREVYPAPAFTFNIMDRIEQERVKNKRFTFNKLPVMNLGISLILTGLLTIFVNVPFINGAIQNYTKKVQYSAATINTNISTTTDSLQAYVDNILNLGGK